MTPSRKGLDRLNISGSAEFSVGEFEKLVSVLKKQANGPIYIVDLRQETHGIFNGNAVSWFGARDWGNIGKNKNDFFKDEQASIIFITLSIVTYITENINSKSYC